MQAYLSTVHACRFGPFSLLLRRHIFREPLPSLKIVSFFVFKLFINRHIHEQLLYLTASPFSGCGDITYSFPPLCLKAGLYVEIYQYQLTVLRDMEIIRRSFVWAIAKSACFW